MLELSSDEAYLSVEPALSVLSEVSLERLPDHRLIVTIETDDPDVVDIVRELAWEYDPTAVQHSLQLADVS